VLAAKKLVEVNGVRAILGTWSSGVSLAVIPLTNDAGTILMNTSGAPALSVPPANEKHLSYRFQATNDRFGRAFAEIAKKEGFKKPATMAFNNASGIGNTEGFTNAWVAGGGTVEKSVVYEPNQSGELIVWPTAEQREELPQDDLLARSGRTENLLSRRVTCNRGFWVGTAEGSRRDRPCQIINRWRLERRERARNPGRVFAGRA